MSDTQAADGLETGQSSSRRGVVQDTIENGSGYARRDSDTLDEGMLLYVAYRSNDADVILRVSVPYSGFSEYLPLFSRRLLLSFLVAVVGSFVVSTRLVYSVTKPFQNISAEMLKVKGDYKGDYTELHFEKCQYPELNVIADTTMEDVQEREGII